MLPFHYFMSFPFLFFSCHISFPISLFPSFFFFFFLSFEGISAPSSPFKRHFSYLFPGLCLFLFPVMTVHFLSFLGHFHSYPMSFPFCISSFLFFSCSYPLFSPSFYCLACPFCGLLFSHLVQCWLLQTIYLVNVCLSLRVLHHEQTVSQFEIQD